MRTWVDHLVQEDLLEQCWCTIEEEAGSGDLIMRQEDAGTTWILGSTSGAIRQLATDKTAGRHSKHRQINHQSSKEEVGSALLEMQRWGDEGVVHRSPLRSAGPWSRRICRFHGSSTFKNKD